MDGTNKSNDTLYMKFMDCIVRVWTVIKEEKYMTNVKKVKKVLMSF